MNKLVKLVDNIFDKRQINSLFFCNINSPGEHKDLNKLKLYFKQNPEASNKILSKKYIIEFYRTCNGNYNLELSRKNK